VVTVTVAVLAAGQLDTEALVVVAVETGVVGIDIVDEVGTDVVDEVGADVVYGCTIVVTG